MEGHHENRNPDGNENVEGYKVEGDGNAPNNPPQPRNESFGQNPHSESQKSENDIPGKEFNINDKAHNDSSKEDFVKTVSKMHHADEDDEKLGKDIPGTL